MDYRITTWIFIAMTVLTTGTAIVLFHMLRLRARVQRIMRQMAKTRQNFFTNITHEFRTPLTVIIGTATELKAKYASDKETVRELDMLLRNSDNMLVLVNQLLDIAKVSSSVGRPDWKRGDVMIPIRMSVDNIRLFAEKKLIDVEFASSSQSIVMDFVPDYIGKILMNLLSNAVKFSEKGDTVTVLASSDSGNLSITVSDTGIGIDSNDLENIFEPFYQGDNSNGRSGTGIGLPLVKQMVIAMKGKIEAYSIKGQGSSFTVTLPLRQHGTTCSKYVAYDEEPKGHDSICNADDLRSDSEDRPVVLIVEDNKDIAEYIGHTLEDRYSLLFAQSGEHGMAKAEEYTPDVIISDIMMPGMNGYELCREIRASQALNHIPVILVTARNEEKDRLRGLECGASAYLVKPFNPQELVIVVSNALRSREIIRAKTAEAMTDEAIEKAGLPEAEKAFILKLHNIVINGISDTGLNSEYIADRIFISRSQLNRKVKAITGTDTATYIRNARMEHAKMLLTSSSNQISDIVIQCGFESASHFSKIFRQSFGMTPTEYRQRRTS